MEVYVNHQGLPASRTHSSSRVMSPKELRGHSLPGGYLRGRDPPVDPGVIAGGIEERQGHEGDGRSDGQGADEAHEEAYEAREAHQHLDTGSDQDGSLQLKGKRAAQHPGACAGTRGASAWRRPPAMTVASEAAQGQGWSPQELGAGEL